MLDKNPKHASYPKEAWKSIFGRSSEELNTKQKRLVLKGLGGWEWFLKRMHAKGLLEHWYAQPETWKAILTDARNGHLGNGYAQGMGQISDARNLHPGQLP